MTSNNLSLLGIAYKASKVVAGTAACEKAIKERKIELLILSSGVSERTKKYFSRLCEDYKTDMVMTQESIGKAIGREYIMVVGVTDKGFKEALTKG